MNIPYYEGRSGSEGYSFFDDIDLGGYYEFDIFLVIKNNETGELLYSTDSGCSCPEPFEGHYLEDFTPITGPQFFYGELYRWANKDRYGSLSAADVEAIGKLQLKVADYFRERRTREAS